MEKYYVAQVDELACQRNPISKLVEVQFSRRPSTFGLLYLAPSQDRPGNQASAGRVWLKLATLNLTIDKGARFATVGEAQLNASNNNGFVTVVDFNTIAPNGCLTIEGSNLLSTTEQVLRSSVLALTQTGDLLAVSMLIERSRSNINSATLLKRPTSMRELGPNDARRRSIRDQTAVAEQFVQLEIEQSDKEGESCLNNLKLHLLSELSYYLYELSLDSTLKTSSKGFVEGAIFQDCRLRLVWQFKLATDDRDQLQERLRHGRARPGAKFVKLTLVVPNQETAPLVLLQLDDGSLRVLSNGRCLKSIRSLSNSISEPALLLTSLPIESRKATGSTRSRFVISCLLLAVNRKRLLTAHNLTLNLMCDQRISEPDQYDSTHDDFSILENERKNQTDSSGRDPDGLLPREPSFEFEQCWSINLNEVEGIGSMFEELEDGIEGGESHEASELDTNSPHNSIRSRQLNPQVCSPRFFMQTSVCLPLRLETGSTAGPTAAGISSSRSQNGLWPNLMLVACKHHVLIYSFEHAAEEAPFSLVYDRAFLNFDSANEPIANTATPMNPADASLSKDYLSKQALDLSRQQRQAGEARMMKNIDLRVEPKLIINFKLIGTQPGDCLFNLLFLTSKINLAQARNFNQLGLLVTVSSAGHILVFKLKSSKVLGLGYKDNVYQRQLLDALRDSSLMRDELNRSRALNTRLQEDLDELLALVCLDADGGGIAEDGKQGGHYEQDHNRVQNFHKKPAQPPMPFDGGGGVFEVRISLEQNERFAGLYDLIIHWPALMLNVTKLIIVSAVEGSVICAPEVFSVECANCVHARPTIKQFNLLSSDQMCQFEFVKAHQKHESASSNQPNNSIVTCAVIELTSSPPNYHFELVADHFQEVSTRQYHVHVPISLQEFKTGPLTVCIQFEPFPSSGLWRDSSNQDDEENDIFLRDYFRDSDGEQRKLISRVIEKSLLGPNEEDQTKSFPATNWKTNKKFIMQHVLVKALNSYRQTHSICVPQNLDSDSQTNHQIKQPTPVVTLELSGPFNFEQILNWLDELLTISAQLINKSNQRETITLTFESKFTYCFIQLQLSFLDTSKDDSLPPSTPQLLKVILKSDDFRALEFIKKHTLMRATDDSIQINVKLSPGNLPTETNLRHLIDGQKLNLNLFYQLQMAQSAAGNSMSERLVQSQTEMLLENLLGELDNLSDTDCLFNELTKSKVWLEREFKQDFERIQLEPSIEFCSEQGRVTELNAKADVEQGNEHDKLIRTQPQVLLENVCEYLVGALLEYESLHSIKTIGSGTVSAVKASIKKVVAGRLGLNPKERTNNNSTLSELILEIWANVKT